MSNYMPRTKTSSSRWACYANSPVSGSFEDTPDGTFAAAKHHRTGYTIGLLAACERPCAAVPSKVHVKATSRCGQKGRAIIMYLTHVTGQAREVSVFCRTLLLPSQSCWSWVCRSLRMHRHLKPTQRCSLTGQSTPTHVYKAAFPVSSTILQDWSLRISPSLHISTLGDTAARSSS